ncbi:hypothetical protein CsatB_014392 [Cannabis sativa]
MLLVPDYDPYNPLPLDVNEGLERCLEFQSSNARIEDRIKSTLNLSCRFRAMLVIFKYSKHENLDPLIPYLALTYFDRFFTRGNFLPRVMGSNDHNVDLMAICCLTLAWKLRKGNFKLSKFKVDKPELEILTAKKLMAMEFAILEGLNWDLRVLTALCFVPYFAPKFAFTDGLSYRTISEIIVNSQEIKIKRQKPSVIAALALLVASSHLYPQKFHSFRDQMISEGIIEEVHIKDCVELMIELCNSLELTFETIKPQRLVQSEVKHGQHRDATAEKENVQKYEQLAGGTHELPNTEKSQDDDAIHEVNETSKQSTTEKTKEDTADVSEVDAAEKSIQGADEESEVVALGETTQGADDPSSKQFPDEKSGQLATQTCEKSIAEEPKQVATDLKTMTTYTSLQREAYKGKKKVGETTSEMAQMAEENEDGNLNFPIRWPLGEQYAKQMIVFHSDSDSSESTLKPAKKKKDKTEPEQSDDDSSMDTEAREPSQEATEEAAMRAVMRASSREKVLDWLKFHTP